MKINIHIHARVLIGSEIDSCDLSVSADFIIHSAKAKRNKKVVFN